MRKLCCKSGPAAFPEQAVEDFNELAEEWGITAEDQLVGVSVTPYTGGMTITSASGTVPCTVVVTFVYWSDN